MVTSIIVHSSIFILVMNSMYGEQYARELGITTSFEDGKVIVLTEITLLSIFR